MANPRTLSKDLGKVFNQEKHSDITLSVDGKLYPAHKILLAARSDVFANLLSQPDNKDVLEIEDVTAEVLEEILRYIYTEKIKRIDQLAKELLVAADKYGLEGLKIVCGQSLFGKVSVSNALDTLKFASKYKADELKRDVIKFIGVNNIELIKTEAWKKLQFDELNFQLLKEIYEASCQNVSIAGNIPAARGSLSNIVLSLKRKAIPQENPTVTDSSSSSNQYYRVPGGSGGGIKLTMKCTAEKKSSSKSGSSPYKKSR